MSPYQQPSGGEQGSPVWRLPIRHGGLMRCCLLTLDTYEGPETEGAVLRCKSCSDSMIVMNGCWIWNRLDIGCSAASESVLP
jgi:hypothetical protein